MNWLNKLGFYHKSQFNEEFLLGEYVKFIGNPADYTLSEEETTNFFKDLQRIDGAKSFFKATAAKDMVRFFQAQPEEQSVIRGAFARTAYILGRLKKDLS